MDYLGRRTDFDRANLVVLQHLQLIDPFLALHKDIIEKYHLDLGITKTDAEVTREHNSSFLCWFKEHVLANPPQQGCTDDESLIYALAHGPAVNLATYQAYDINGYTFCTEEKDKKSDYQNSGVTMESMNGDGVLERFYGRLEEIWELVLWKVQRDDVPCPMGWERRNRES